MAVRVVQATGRVVRDAIGLELIVQRRLPLPAAEVWEWMTAPARLKQWMGVLRGRPAVGATLQLKMTAEDGAPTEPLEVIECDPLRRYVVEQGTGGQVWRLRVSLAETTLVTGEPVTTVFLGHRLDSARLAGDVGPGWEYYLDRLVAAVDGTPMPDFADYYPQQKPYFERIAMDGDPVGWPAS
jgi:uncharacterized protein YndB with AHSA1/START domain